MAITIRHPSTVTTPDDGASDVGSDEWNAAHTVSGELPVANGGTAGTSIATACANLNLRERLTAARTYYVRTDGSDSNTGLADTAGGAFLTIQHGLDVICGTLDFGVYNCTLQVRTGTFVGGAAQGPTPSAGGQLVIRGNGVANTTVTPNTDWSAGLMVRGHAGHRCTINGGWTFAGANDGSVYLRADGGECTMFIAGALACTGDNPTDTFVMASDNSYLEMTSTAVTIGGDLDHYMACYNSTIKHNFCTYTLSGTPAWSTAFVDVSEGSNSTVHMESATFSGSATGLRFRVIDGGSLITGNDSPTYFPGDVAGTSDGTGHYNTGHLNVKAIALTYAQLPATPLAGMMCYVTDSNTATWGATVASGGANKVLAWYNGTNWTVAGA
jgi:hypothetical protein